MKKRIKAIFSKPRVFAITFWKSLTKPNYYKDIKEAKLSFSLKYLFILFLLTSLIVAVGVSVRMLGLIPESPKFIESTKSFILETYPDELELTLKEGKITTNVKEPYFIDLAEDKKVVIAPFEHLIAIDTKADSEEIKNLNSLLLITDDNLVVWEGSGSAAFRTFSLSDALSKMPNGVSMDKTLFTSILETFAPYVIKTLPKIIIAISLLIFIFYPLIAGSLGFLFRLIFLLPASLILFIFVKLLKKNLSFAKTYQMSLHGATVPTVISFVFSFPSLYPYVSTLSWIAFFVFMFVVISRLDKSR